MGLVLNPVGFRVGYLNSWSDAWYVHRIYYPEFLHNILLIKILIFYFTFEYFPGKRSDYLYSHIKFYFYKNKIYINLFFYNAENKEYLYNIKKNVFFKQFVNVRLKTFWIKKQILDWNKLAQSWFYLMQMINIRLDLIDFEYLEFKFPYWKVQKIKRLKKKYGEDFIAREEIYMIKKMLKFMKFGNYNQFGIKLAKNFFEKWYGNKKKFTYRKEKKSLKYKKGLKYLKYNYIFLFFVTGFIDFLLNKYNWLYPYKVLRNLKDYKKIIYFYYFWIKTRPILKQIGKFIELIIFKFGYKVKVNIFFLNNISLSAAFIARYIGYTMLLKFNFWDIMIPIRKNLNKIMYFLPLRKLKMKEKISNLIIHDINKDNNNLIINFLKNNLRIILMNLIRNLLEMKFENKINFVKLNFTNFILFFKKKKYIITKVLKIKLLNRKNILLNLNLIKYFSYLIMIIYFKNIYFLKVNNHLNKDFFLYLKKNKIFILRKKFIIYFNFKWNLIFFFSKFFEWLYYKKIYIKNKKNFNENKQFLIKQIFNKKYKWYNDNLWEINFKKKKNNIKFLKILYYFLKLNKLNKLNKLKIKKRKFKKKKKKFLKNKNYYFWYFWYFKQNILYIKYYKLYMNKIFIDKYSFLNKKDLILFLNNFKIIKNLYYFNKYKGKKKKKKKEFILNRKKFLKKSPLENKLKKWKWYDKDRSLLYGYKFQFNGRFRRKQRAANFWFLKGAMPLSTISENVDYSFFTIRLKYSVCTIKVWLYKGKKAPNYNLKLY